MKRTAMKRRSTARAKQERLYLKMVKVYLLKNPICHACKENTSTQNHHKKGRLGPLLTDETYFMAVCNNCHWFIENRKEAATKLGWRLDRIGNL